jgi:hypothetical protein
MNYKVIVVLSVLFLLFLLLISWRRDLFPSTTKMSSSDIFSMIGALGSIATVLSLIFLIVQINDTRKATLNSSKPFILLPTIYEFQVNRDTTISGMNDEVIQFSGRNYFYTPFCLTNIGKTPALDIQMKFEYDLNTLNEKLLENYQSGGHLTSINGYIRDEGSHKISLGYISSEHCDFNGSFFPKHFYPYILETMFETLPEIFVVINYKDMHGNKYQLRYKVYRTMRSMDITLDEKQKTTIVIYFDSPVETIELAK